MFKDLDVELKIHEENDGRIFAHAYLDGKEVHKDDLNKLTKEEKRALASYLSLVVFNLKKSK